MFHDDGNPPIAEGRFSDMKWPRRILLELSALLLVSGVLGFLGPFGTYLTGDLVSRAVSWAMLLFGAYVLARPTMELWRWTARATRLPQAPLVFWGMILSSVPIALIWKVSGADGASLIGGYASVFSFTVLCSLLVMAVAWWAERAEASLLRYYGGAWAPEVAAPSLADGQPLGDTTAKASTPVRPVHPRLRARLSPGFTGDILALESEDHYVRVHGMRGSELLLIRLRDAIAEMDGLPGEQTHRSWWVARGAVADVHARGRGCEIKLTNGERALVARDSVDRLTRSRFLPG
jgi:hypothetical protein